MMINKINVLGSFDRTVKLLFIHCEIFHFKFQILIFIRILYRIFYSLLEIRSLKYKFSPFLVTRDENFD